MNDDIRGKQTAFFHAVCFLIKMMTQRCGQAALNEVKSIYAA